MIFGSQSPQLGLVPGPTLVGTTEQDLTSKKKAIKNVFVPGPRIG